MDKIIMPIFVNMCEIESRKKELFEIRDIVVNWYAKNCLENEKETFDFNQEEKEGRLKVFILAVFFNCIFQEETALDMFRKMEEHNYLELHKLDDFEANLKKVLRGLEHDTERSHKILRIQNMIDSVRALKELFSQEGDVIEIFNQKGNFEDFAKFLYDKFSGIKVKIFWIGRECRNLFGVPEEYCYVPDSHVTKFLYNIGFLTKRGQFSLEDCFEISRNMARFLGNKYFDLPFMRYHQSNCAKCEKGKMTKCEIDCIFGGDS